MVLPPVVQAFYGAQQTRSLDLDTRWGTVHINVVPKIREKDGALRELAKTTRLVRRGLRDGERVGSST